MKYDTLEIAKFVLADIKRIKKEKAETEARIRSALYDGPLIGLAPRFVALPYEKL